MVHTLAGMRTWVVRSGSLAVPEPEVERHSRQLQPGNTQHTGYDGIEPVQSQREPDKAAQNIEDKQEHKAHDGVEQQFQSEAKGLFEQLEKNGQKSRGHTDDQHDD